MTMYWSKWDRRFMRRAQDIADWSKDWIGVGAVLVRQDNTVAGEGFNGPPRGVRDDIWMRVSDAKLHAEENAIGVCRDFDLTAHRMFVWPVTCCAHCAAWLIQKNLRHIIVPMHWTEVPERLKDRCRIGAELLNEAGVRVDIMRPETEADECTLHAWRHKVDAGK